jgi:hypothetical protein
VLLVAGLAFLGAAGAFYVRNRPFNGPDAAVLAGAAATPDALGLVDTPEPFDGPALADGAAAIDTPGLADASGLVEGPGVIGEPDSLGPHEHDTDEMDIVLPAESDPDTAEMHVVPLGVDAPRNPGSA